MLSSNSDTEIQKALDTLKRVGVELGRLNEDFPSVAAARRERALEEQQKRAEQSKRRRRRQHLLESDDDDDEDTFVSNLGNVYSP
jgi:hypothetical protein